MVGMAIATWWPAFTLGAWGEIFFDQLLALWAASIAAFVFVLVERRPVRARLARAFALLLPSLWVVVMFFLGDETDDVFVVLVQLSALLAVFIGMPFTIWVLVRIIWPDFGTEMPGRTKWLIVLVVIGVAVASFVLGLNQSRFLTCDDFAISGNSLPPGCRPAPTATP
ncbi:hypothetical protein F6B43_13310 [Microbacterium rhizomatis]|uniref:Uncharacterized protein n=2 Tax=Microbacterium rhizomatis TaxID=1631477 RepID=A0A5J5J3U4_9MICO|nr:hypothetical protein F6B43_13310 [Microbacterium rhizomatis]